MALRRQARLQVTATDGTVTRKHRPDYRLVLFMGLLVLVGLVVLFAVSPYQIHRINEGGGSIDQSHFMLKQLLYLGVGVAAFALATFLRWNFGKNQPTNSSLALSGYVSSWRYSAPRR
jgi:cell division protein FtsW (lipid II flippase)